MIYGIASYKRPACRTVRTLIESGVNKKDIVISLQSKEDLREYTGRFKDFEILFDEKDSAAGNRNTLLKKIRERPIVLLDDDIVSFSYMTDGGRFVVNNERCLQTLQCLAEEEHDNIPIIGVSPNANGIIGRKRPEISVDVLLQGSLLLILSNKLRFDESFKMVEDYEISLRTIYEGNHTLRMNYICANKPKNGTNLGGMHDRYANNELPFWLRLLHKKYNIFVPNKGKTGGNIKWPK